MITIIKNIPLINDVFNYDVILVGTSINNALGNGFQRQIRINFPIVDKINKTTNYGDPRKLGTVKVINSTPIFCLCYTNHTILLSFCGAKCPPAYAGREFSPCFTLTSSVPVLIPLPSLLPVQFPFPR